MTAPLASLIAICLACWCGGLVVEPFHPAAWAISAAMLALSLWSFVDPDLRQ